MKKVVAKRSIKPSKKPSLRLKDFYTLFLMVLFGLFLVVTYYAAQQSHVYESGAAQVACNSINKLNIKDEKKRDRCQRNERCRWVGNIKNGRCTAKPTRGGSNDPTSSPDPENDRPPENLIIDAADISGGTDLKPGDRISDHGISVIVPRHGQTLYASLDKNDSAGNLIGQTFVVSTSLNGEVTVDKVGDESSTALSLQRSAQASASSSQNECEDGFKELLDYRWRTTLEWYLNTRTIPNYLNEDQALADIREAHLNWTQEENNCNRNDALDMTTNYRGTTTELADIGVVDGETACYQADGQNTIDFGVLGSTDAAVTCTWVDENNNAVESDIRLSRAVRWTTNSECIRRRSNIEGTVTHERGHSFGLGDIYDDGNGHQQLTMGGGNPQDCGSATGASTLGVGDMDGLEEKY